MKFKIAVCIFGFWMASMQGEAFLKASEKPDLLIQNSPAANGNASLDQALLKVKIGNTAVVTDSSGREQKIKVLDLSPKSLSFAVHGTRRELAAGDIRALDIMNHDSLRNGALIGFGAGAGVTTVAAILLRKEINWTALPYAFAYCGIGTALGVFVDLMVEERLPVYRAAAAKHAAMRVSFSPLITPDKKGVALTLRLAP